MVTINVYDSGGPQSVPGNQTQAMGAEFAPAPTSYEVINDAGAEALPSPGLEEVESVEALPDNSPAPERTPESFASDNDAPVPTLMPDELFGDDGAMPEGGPSETKSSSKKK